jgi:hypothetical protein
VIRARYIWYAAGLLFACTNRQQYVFGAYVYDPEADCLAPPAAVDVISGPDPGPCDRLRCWISPEKQVYVTDAACEAPVGFDDHTADGEGGCREALLAYEREDHGACAGSAGSGAGSEL